MGFKEIYVGIGIMDGGFPAIKKSSNATLCLSFVFL